LPLELDGASNITIANLHMYRVVSSSQPFAYAIKATNSKAIRFRNVHCYSNSKVSFDNTIYDPVHRSEVRQREFSWLTITGNAPPQFTKDSSPLLADGAKLEKIATGFFNISGGAIDRAGNFYFVDPKWQTIYRCSARSHVVSKVRDAPLEPVQLVFDKAGDLIVISSAAKGSIYSFKPDAPDNDVTLLKPESAQPRPEMIPVLPVDYWGNADDFIEKIQTAKSYQFLSPDNSVFIPAGEDFVSGQLYYGAKMHDVLRAFGMAPAIPGHPFYVSDEAEQKTYSGHVRADGTLSSLKLFAERGGEGLAVDTYGDVYMAAGQVFVYNSSGQLIETIDIPERPSQLVFGGSDGKTLFIPARSSLYAIRTR